MTSTERTFTSVEICAGAGGQALGLHDALFRHLALIEIDPHAVETLRANVEGNDDWEGCTVKQADLTMLDPKGLRLELGLEPGDLDLLAGGVPCPPFSVAGKQLGPDDERDLFPTMLNLVDELEPKAVMIENVRGLLEPREKFQDYREHLLERLESMGYKKCYWEVLEAKNYGVPQLRPRAILVALKEPYLPFFAQTKPKKLPVRTVGEALKATMAKRFAEIDDPRAAEALKEWQGKASKGVAPTLVGGSKKHGGADLGPTRAKKAWAALGVCGLGVANDSEEMKKQESYERDLFSAAGPKLTVEQAAIIQGFPPSWKFKGRKTAAYRQVGNAFPPPVAQAVGEQIIAALKAGKEAGVVAAVRQPRSEGSETGSELLFRLTELSAPAAPKAANRGSDRERAVVG
ncbi:DNA (cytosine-5-)-methyltransferase [Streptomyces sp. MBT67]|uniref:DNA cytosine methyltransferase n=1 Tax=unclassified Streptomyces TaxID=2593676 RepID=UPI00190CBE52|nr:MULTISPECIES: DNA (cytosine-5-)-methyltransferase [unclassified Streptomyces]MBK3529900.1 DNA (cytosine-5-)-methyltransferase [Streptomyces sp. MBT72]MBK3535238.1 DNA (cytosine-5-)-methyltransferase [Streptomyces sp. MBT67]MBK3550060.1 DNA (cytosine-5-)-methyltransferase [Streptomyces sp. MBT61]MBK6030389.1 DNA (cytosine-5-)-methyltransferase [Streptomyces sp. MBT59]